MSWDIFIISHENVCRYTVTYSRFYERTRDSYLNQGWEVVAEKRGVEGELEKITEQVGAVVQRKNSDEIIDWGKELEAVN